MISFSRAQLILGIAVGLISIGQAAKLNADAVLFGSITKSSQAAPKSCITLTVTTQIINNGPFSNVDPLISLQNNQNSKICPSDSASSELHFFHLFDISSVDNDPQNSSSKTAMELGLLIQATQPAASSGMELRWTSMSTLPLDGSSIHLAINMAAAQLHKAPSSAVSKNTSSSSKSNLDSTDMASFSLPTAQISCPGQQHPASETSPSGSHSFASLAATAVLALAAGTFTGKFASTKLSPKPVIKETCEVACSPFVFPKQGRAGKNGNKTNWTRDQDGRLMRDGMLATEGSKAEVGVHGGLAEDAEE